MVELPRSPDRAAALDDTSFPGYAMGAAAAVIGVTPAFLRSAEAGSTWQTIPGEG